MPVTVHINVSPPIIPATPEVDGSFVLDDLLIGNIIPLKEMVTGENVAHNTVFVLDDIIPKKELITGENVGHILSLTLDGLV